MKNRDLFLDLVEEIDVRHLDRHYRRNTETKKKKIMRYATAVGMYAAACLVLVLLVPYIIGQTGVMPFTPGNEKQTIEEALADTKLFRVLNTLGISYKEVDSLAVDDYMVYDGEVYSIKDDKVYLNLEEHPYIKTELKIDSFLVGDCGIFFTATENGDPAENRGLYCAIGEEIVTISEDNVLCYGENDGELVYVTADPENSAINVYSYSAGDKKVSLAYSINTARKTVEEIYLNGDQPVAVLYDPSNHSSSIMEYDVDAKEWKNLWSISSDVRFAFADSEEEYYFSCEWTRFEDEVAIDEGVLKRHIDGVWYMNPDTEKLQKISGTHYDELYCVNGSLAGINGDEITIVEENYTVEGNLFPRPESMTISYGWKSHTLMAGDPLYEYLYEKINARVDDGSITEVTDREHPDEYIYRENETVRVQFKYYYDSKGAPIYPDKENIDTAFAPAKLYFPLTGENTDVVFLTVREKDTERAVTRSFGVLAEDPEIKTKIMEFFSEADVRQNS